MSTFLPLDLSLAATSWTEGRVNIVGVNRTGHMLHMSWPEQSQTGWDLLGGSFQTITPTIISQFDDRLDVFGLEQSTFHMLHSSWNGTYWSSWETVGTQQYYQSSLAATSWGPGRLDVFGLSLADRQVHRQWSGLEGGGRSQPVAVSYAASRLDVVVLGDNSSLYWKSWNPDGWTNWTALGIVDTEHAIKLHRTPAIVSLGPKRLDLFALSEDNFLYHLAYVNGVWDSAWNDLGGVEANSPPVAVAWAANRLDVFLTTRDSTVMHLGWNGSDWTPWNSLGQLKVVTAASTSSVARNSSMTSSASSTDARKKEGLSSRVLAGVVAACVVAAALVFGGFFWYWLRRRRSSRAQSRAENPQPLTSNDIDANPTAAVEKKRPLTCDGKHELGATRPPELEAQEIRELDAGDVRLPELYGSDVLH